MTPAVDITDAATTDRSLVKAAQTLLRALGYTPTEFGTLDTSTRSAIESFQKLEGLDRDGQVTPLLILRLAQAVASRCGTR
jgi:peptidoglycan hydrolase-like protein with peptidoglycan-binding domain